MFDLHRSGWLLLSAGAHLQFHLVKEEGVVLHHRAVVIYHCPATEHIPALGITTLVKLVSRLESVAGGSRLAEGMVIAVVCKYIDVLLDKSLSRVVGLGVPFSIFLLHCNMLLLLF